MSFLSIDSPPYERAEITTASVYNYAARAEINSVSEPSASYSAAPFDEKHPARRNAKLSRMSSFGSSWDFSEVD